MPQSFDGIPVLNNQKSWFFPYAKDRAPDHINKLWQVFALGLQLADAEDEQPLAPFRAAFDAAMELYGVAWNLTFGLYWCRPWSFLSLDERSRGYLADKLRLILQGPPGTGKTWLARRLAKALIGHDAQEPQLRSVQFHPNLSYEDFVRGWRPTGSVQGSGTLTLHDGVFLQMVSAALAAPAQRHVLVIEEIIHAQCIPDGMEGRSPLHAVRGRCLPEAT